jgi:hypothetical protein
MGQDRSDDEVWPVRDCPYERPLDTPANGTRWQAALDRALTARTLMLEQESGFTFQLSGACPRCGHDTVQTVTFRVLHGWGRKSRTRRHAFNFGCACQGKHAGRPDGVDGCGWGGPLRVEITMPEGLDHG